MSRPKLLDLFCGGGGCSVGYDRAGFDVTGVDIQDHPEHPYNLIVADALEVLEDGPFLSEFDAIHASPPCQRYAGVTSWRGNQADHPDLIPPVRAALQAWGGPWVIENVPGAPVRADFLLCGSMFGLRVRRHRIFETSGWHADTYQLNRPCDHRGLLPFMHKGERAYADAMGCTWMSSKVAREAIPPAYTEHIGTQLIDSLSVPA